MVLPKSQELYLDQIEVENEIMACAKAISMRLENRFDSVNAVTGHVGTGKSTLAIKLSIALLRVLGKDTGLTFKEFLDKFMLYIPSGSDIDRKLNQFDHRPIIVDEAVEALFKADHARRIAIEIAKSYVTTRKQCNASYLCMPRLVDFQSYFRASRINTWFRIYSRDYVRKRSTVMVLQRDWADDISRDPWGIEEMLQYTRQDRKVDLNRKYRGLHTYTGIEFEFSPIKDEFFDVYEAESNAARHAFRELHDQQEETMSKREVHFRNRFYRTVNNLKNVLKLSAKQIGVATECTEQDAYVLLNAIKNDRFINPHVKESVSNGLD